MASNVVTVTDIAAEAVSDDMLLLDVREEAEWNAGHAPTAMHMAMTELPARADELPHDQPIAVICRSGARSAQVAAYLLFHGRADVVNVAGGMRAWHKAGRPMASADGSDPWVA